MDHALAQRVSQNCLSGRPLPRSLEILWDHQPNTDQCPVCLDDLDAVFDETTLITDLSWFDGWFDDSPDSRALASVLDQIGFFAESKEALLGYWWGTDVSEPPVVRVDTEGNFFWHGSVADALLWPYDEDDEDWAEDLAYAKEWFTDHNLEVGVPVEGPPDLERLRTRLYTSTPANRCASTRATQRPPSRTTR